MSTMATQKVYQKVHSKLPHYLYVFPVISGLTWFATLSILLLYWIAIGRPRFPYQHNPYVAFISNIAAYHLKPLFIIGSTVTAITFIGTIFSVDYARRSRRFYGSGDHEKIPRKLIALLTLMFSIIAAASFFCLSIFDTTHAHQRHRLLLFSTFGGLGFTAVGTGLVWGDVLIGWKRVDIGLSGNHSAISRLRIWCAINFAVMVLIVIVGILFVISLTSSWWRVAGVLEWTVSYLGSLWLLTFAGLLYRTDEDDQDNHIDANVGTSTESENESETEIESENESESESESDQDTEHHSEYQFRPNYDYERAPLLTDR